MLTRILGLLFASLVAFTVGIEDVEAAKRLGGGRNVGTQRESIQREAPRPPQQAPQQAQPTAPRTAPAPAPAPAPSGASRWLGPLAGLAAGGLLGAMLFGGAFEGVKFMDIAMILLLAAGVFFIFRMLRKPQEHSRPEPMQYAGVGADPRIDPQVSQLPAQEQAPPRAAATTPTAHGSYFPAGFDAEAFAQNAKQNFIRLQAANDRRDLAALRDVVTPALLRDIEAAMQERGGASQKIEVVTLDAQVIEVVTEGSQYVASVRFSGLIKEDPAGQPEQFSEVWHLQKPTDGSSGWLVAGIQQD